MTNLKPIIQEKLNQAVGLLNEPAQPIDCWITFVRETSQVRDPALDLILDFDLTWDSALIVTRNSGKIAIVGRYDASNVENLEAYDEVVPYDQGISETLRARIVQLNPASIALNYSLSDPGSDGLTFGMYARLTQILAGTAYATSLVSAESIVRRLRERKTDTELQRIRAITATTEQVYADLLSLSLRGLSEIQVHALAGDIVARHGVEFGWERVNNPIVNAGPYSPIGHSIPGAWTVEPGHLLHLDMGLRHDGYCSDLQRMAYVLREGEAGAPAEVIRAWQACRAALETGRSALKPGAIAWQVDAAARAELVRQGYPEYMHAFGHHVGRHVHDGGSLLGPRWERYGNLPEQEIDAGDVFAIELGTPVEGIGYIGLEELVTVTPSGAEYISQPQMDLILL